MNTTDFACRSCGKTGPAAVLSLGSAPLAGTLLTKAQVAEAAASPGSEARFPLDLVFCDGCSLVQIMETVPPETMFRDHAYLSSSSEAMIKHAEEIATRVAEERKLGKDSLVIEIASNDGYLLQSYAKLGVPVLGIEPARAAAKAATDRGIRTVSEFFGKDLASSMVKDGQRADVIHLNNVLAHVADLNGFASGVALTLKDDGVAVIETPYVKELLENREIDAIYHEHYSHFSLTALVALMERHALVVTEVERLRIHGGSLRLFVSKKKGPKKAPKPNAAVKKLLAEEAAGGVATLAPFTAFAKVALSLKAELIEKISELRDQGARIAGYGAAAKGSTLLHFLGVGKNAIDFVVDRDPAKQGRFMPGSHIPVVGPDELRTRAPDVCMLLTWSSRDEIVEHQAVFRENGGKFLVPLPAVIVL